MRKLHQIVITIFTVSLLTRCDFIERAFTYKDKTKELIENLLKEDYDQVMKSFAMEHEMAKNTDPDVMKQGLIKFRESMIQDFGRNLDYRFMKAEKNWSTEKEKKYATKHDSCSN